MPTSRPSWHSFASSTAHNDHISIETRRNGHTPAGTMVSDHQLKVFYASERRLLQRLVVNYAVEPILAVLTIALWLFMESAGHLSLIHCVLKSDDNYLLVSSLAIEAQRILSHLRDPSKSTTRAAAAVSVECTSRLLKRAFTIHEFGDRRWEIIPWINDTVAKSLSRAFDDIYVVPAHAVSYLTELVPLRHEETRIRPIGSRRLGGELLRRANGFAYPWTGLADDLVKPFVNPSLFSTSRVEPAVPGLTVLDRKLVGSMNNSLLGVQTMAVNYTTSRHRHGSAGGSMSLMPPAVFPVGVAGLVPNGLLFNPNHGGGAVGAMHQVPYSVAHPQLPNLLPPFTVMPAGAAYERQDTEPSETSACYSQDQFDDDHSDSGTDGSGSEAAVGRTLFVTFSRGYPLEAHELREYFGSVYGEVVERVMVQRTKGMRPLFAKLVLTSPEALAAVLGGQKKIKMVIQGRDAWARKYERKKKKNQQSVSRRELLRHP